MKTGGRSQRCGNPEGWDWAGRAKEVWRWDWVGRVYLLLIRTAVRQKPIHHCKAITLQIKISVKKYSSKESNLFAHKLTICRINTHHNV